MLRAILEGSFLFVLPFMGFAIYLALKGQNPLQPGVWSRKALSSLTLVALGVCIVGVLVMGASVERQMGTFVPAHVDKSGTFVPGTFTN